MGYSGLYFHTLSEFKLRFSKMCNVKLTWFEFELKLQVFYTSLKAEILKKTTKCYTKFELTHSKKSNIIPNANEILEDRQN